MSCIIEYVEDKILLEIARIVRREVVASETRVNARIDQLAKDYYVSKGKFLGVIAAVSVVTTFLIEYLKP